MNNYPKELSATAIIEAFPEEIKNILPLKIRMLKKELSVFDNFIKKVKGTLACDEFTKYFYLEALKVFMPVERFKLLAKMKTLKKIANGKLKNIDINKIREAKNISFSKFITYKKRGQRGWAICPFHKEKTASFMVNIPKNNFRCFGCGVHGDLIDFVQKLNEVSFTQAIDIILS